MRERNELSPLTLADAMRAAGYRTPVRYDSRVYAQVIAWELGDKPPKTAKAAAMYLRAWLKKELQQPTRDEYKMKPLHESGYRLEVPAHRSTKHLPSIIFGKRVFRD